MEAKFDKKVIALQEDYAVTSLRRLIERANEVAQEKKWQYGRAALSEIRAIVANMPDSLPKDSTRSDRVPKVDDGDLTNYLLAGCRCPKQLFDRMSRPPLFPLSSGLAVIKDVARTKRILQSVDDTVKELVNSGKACIEVVDAGSGPVALLGLYAALVSNKVRATCIEGNFDSYKFAAEIVKKFGLQDRVRLLHGDALRHTHSAPIDLLLSETMSVGLTNEPMVQIMRNFKPQMGGGGIMIPSEVLVKAAIVDVSALENPRSWVFSRYSWVPVVDRHWHTAASYRAGEALEKIFCEIDLTGLTPGKYAVILSSDVTMGKYRLSDYESFLSLPIEIDDIFGMKMRIEIKGGRARPQKVQIDYAPGQKHACRLLY